MSGFKFIYLSWEQIGMLLGSMQYLYFHPFIYSVRKSLVVCTAPITSLAIQRTSRMERPILLHLESQNIWNERRWCPEGFFVFQREEFSDLFKYLRHRGRQGGSYLISEIDFKICLCLPNSDTEADDKGFNSPAAVNNRPFLLLFINLFLRISL